jgi:gliding motility-associated-like protein
MKHTLLIVSVFFGLLAGEATAQSLLKNVIYRVTAFKRGNTMIVSQSNHKEIIPPLRMYIPSAFTPNGDGLNDQFGVKGEGVTDFRIRVYDRWGEVIFESDNAQLQWDGSYKGQPVQEGTYVYQVSAKGLDRRNATGSVTLIR